MKGAVPWVLGAALVVAAGAAVALTPPDVALSQAFSIRGGEGDLVTGRTLTAQVRDAAFTERVVAGDWAAEGNWLVVTVAASAPQTEVDAAISLAKLEIGDRTFHASERVRDSLLGAALRVGTDTVGMLAFELPADVDAGDAELSLITSYSTPQLDDVVVLPVSLDDLPSEAEIEITSPEWEGF
ncbi:MAG TPA: hypothetical protein VN035_04745 [Microbacterium sp.]|nr:hypothetical protein [Microbacterium sp.]